MKSKRLLLSAILTVFSSVNIFIPLYAQTKSQIADGLRLTKTGSYSQSFVPEENTEPEPQEEKLFDLDPLAEVVIAGGALGVIAFDYLKTEKNTKKGKNPTFTGVRNPSEIPATDAIFYKEYNKTFDYIGTGLQFAAMLTPAVFVMAPKKDWFTVGIMYTESLLWAYGLKNLGKAMVYRARPYTYATGWPQKDVDDGDWYNSFPSGHATMAFNAATFTTLVYGSFFPEGKTKYIVGAGCYAIAAATAASRIMSGNHFLSDVLTGAAIGTTTGLMIPIAHTYIAQLNASGKGLTARLLPNGLLFKYEY